MSTKTISYNTPANSVAANLNELSIFDSTYLINKVEEQIAIIQRGSSAIALKSFRSARFSLINKLAQKKSLRILSYETTSAWENDLEIFARNNVSILYKSDYSDLSLDEIIKSKKIDVVYIATIHSDLLEVENHSKIIKTTHSHNAIVIYDNSPALGSFYKPLADYADYTLINVAETEFKRSGIGAFLVEGLNKSQNNNSIVNLSGESILTQIKENRKWQTKQKFLLSSDGLELEEQLSKTVEKYRSTANTSFKLAKLLNQETLVAEVNYPGLKTSGSFVNAENQLNSFGSKLKFRLWNTDFANSLLRSYLITGKPAGIIISYDKELREFSIEIKTNDTGEVLNFFTKVFSILSKELEYRAILKKQLKLQEALKEFLHV